MTFINNRMQMARYQHNMPKGPQININNCNCKCGGNNRSIWGFNAGGIPPMGGNPFGYGGIGGFGYGNGFSFGGFGFGPGFGRGMGSLFKAFAIGSIVSSSANFAFNLIDNILGWCGFGGGTQQVQQQQQQQTEGQVSDLDMLKQIFTDSPIRDLGNGQYEVFVNGNQYKGTYDEILKATGKTSTKKSEGTGGAGSAGGGDGAGAADSPKTDAEKTQIKTDTTTKIDAAKNAGEVKLPEGCTQQGETEVTVADDGTVSIKVKYKENGEDKELTVSGKDADEAVDNLSKECQKLQKEVAEAKIKENNNLNVPEGYKIETSGVNKDGKIQATYILVDSDGNKTEFDSIDALKAGIEALAKKDGGDQGVNTKSTTRATNSKKSVIDQLKLEINTSTQASIRSIKFNNDKVIYTDRFGEQHEEKATEENIRAAIAACNETPQRPKCSWEMETDSFLSSDQNFITKKNNNRYEMNIDGDWANTDKFEKKIDHSGHETHKIICNYKQATGYIALTKQGTLSDSHGETMYKDKFPVQTDKSGNVYVQTQENGEWILLEEFLNNN